MSETVQCPKCGQENSSTAYFCTICHAILIHRCPNCWHEQRQGTTCEKCGTIFALYWELELEHSIKEQDRITWDKCVAGVAGFVQILLLPFSSLGGLLRALVARLIALRLSNRQAG